MIETSPSRKKRDKDLDHLLSWGRYLYWCDLNKKEFKKFIGRERSMANWRFVALTARWYASLWVVIEGWRSIGLKDNWIDKLIAFDGGRYATLLKKFRNATYHYHPSLLDEHQTNLLKEEKHVVWVEALHQEFLRFLWEYPRGFLGSKSDKEKAARAMRRVIGWMPDDTIFVVEDSLARLISKSEKMLRNGSPDNPVTSEVVSALENGRRFLDQKQSAAYRDALIAMLSK